MYWLKDWKNCTTDSVIYLLYCVSNFKFYIGSAQNLRARMYGHQIKLLHGSSDKFVAEHANIHLQRIYNKHGIDTLQVHILEYVSADETLEVEQKWLDAYFGTPKCVNLNPKAVGSGHGMITVRQYSKTTGEFIQEFESLVDAALTFSKSENSSLIMRNCKRQDTSAYGYIWRYAEDNIDKISSEYLDVHKSRRRPIYLYSCDGILLETYESKTLAVKAGHSRASHIAKHGINGMLYTGKGVLTDERKIVPVIRNFCNQHINKVSEVRSKAGKIGGKFRKKQPHTN